MNDLDVPKGSQPPSRHRFYIGSAAIFWFFVALVMWARLFFTPAPFTNDDMSWDAWFRAWQFSAPAFVMVLLAIFIRNQSDTNIPPWLITPPVFVFIIYMMIIKGH
jgi:hypothetical protein